MTLNSDNMEEVTKIRDILPDSVRVKYSPLMRMGRGMQTNSDDAIGNEEFHNVCRQTDLEGRGANRLQNGQRSLSCYADDAHICVADNGDVYPCHLFHQNAFKMGNIFVDKIADIFHFATLTAGRLGSDPVFTRQDGGVWSKSHQLRPMLEACTSAKIKPAVSFHVLRHTHGSTLAVRGVPMAVIAEQLGHSDTRMTKSTTLTLRRATSPTRFVHISSSSA